MGRSNTPPPKGPDADAPGPDDLSRDHAAAIASYIGDMAAELSQLAGSADLPMVAYFLNLARAEAQASARESAPEKKKKD